MTPIADSTIDLSAAQAAQVTDTARLGALKATGMLDAIPEEAFERAVRLASTMLGVPVSLVSLVDADRQVFKAQIGLQEPVCTDRETPLSHSFCQYVVARDDMLAISDARKHPVLKHNGAVRDMGVIAYLGIPVHGPTGHTLGSFCAIDSAPRNWTEQDRMALADIAAIVENEIRLRDEVDRRQLIMQELSHRVGNLFSVISGMVAITARHEETPRSMSTTLRGRISALARAHDLILPTIRDVGQGSAPASLHETVQSLLEPYFHNGADRYTCDGAQVQLGPRATIDMSLVLHELATNAAKYGALSTEEGCIHLSWKIADDSLHLHWRETGGPQIFKTPDGPTGFGTRLIDLSVEQSLNGSMTTAWHAAGAEHHLIVPVEQLLY